MSEHKGVAGFLGAFCGIVVMMISILAPIAALIGLVRLIVWLVIG